MSDHSAGGEDGRSGFAYDGFQVDPKWPGLDVKDGIDVHHPRVKNLIKNLEADVERLKGINAGTLQHLRVYGAVTSAHVGEWDAAQTLATTFTQGHTAVTTGYQSLITQYETTLEAIKTAFGNIENAEKGSDVGKVTLT